MKLNIMSFYNGRGSVKKCKNGTKTTNDEPELWRDLLAFWILGLCTEIGYVVIICAAYDILYRFDNLGSKNAEPKLNENESEHICNTKSSGILLLADIVPSLIMNLVCPFLPLVKNVRMVAVCILNTTSFLLIAFAITEWQAVLGIVCTSLALGMGEVTLLSYSSKFNRKVVKAWSSGTGGAGIIGSLSYASLVTLGMEPNNTLILMLFIPILEAVTFWILLRTPTNCDETKQFSETKPDTKITNDLFSIELGQLARIKISDGSSSNEVEKLSGIKKKLEHIPSLFKFMVPLMLVFIFEYSMVSGLFEMVYVKDIWLDHQSQYRWFLVVYQIGVFVSRSTGTLLSIHTIWWLPFLQSINVIYFILEVLYAKTPSIWIIFAMVFWVGSLGGLSYVHTICRLVNQVPHVQQKFSLGMVTIAESVGIALGGLITIPMHSILCRKIF